MNVIISGKHWKNEKTFPSLNDYITELGKNPKAGGRMKSKYEKIACDSLRLAFKGEKLKPPITIHYRFYEPEKGHLRDHMNIFAFADKCIQDALQKCGILKDDSPRFVDGNRITHEFFYTKGMPRIEVEFEQLG